MLDGSVANFDVKTSEDALTWSGRGIRRPERRTVRPRVRPSSRASVAIWPFRIICMSSIPTEVRWAASNDLNPSMGRVTRFTPLWSCSITLLKYLT